LFFPRRQLQPPSELSGGPGVVPRFHGPLRADPGPALEHRAAEEGQGEEPERQPDPGLAEIELKDDSSTPPVSSPPVAVFPA